MSSHCKGRSPDATKIASARTETGSLDDQDVVINQGFPAMDFSDNSRYGDLSAEIFGLP